MHSQTQNYISTFPFKRFSSRRQQHSSQKTQDNSRWSVVMYEVMTLSVADVKCEASTERI